MKTLEIEGPWEEVLARSSELSGRRVRLTVLPEADIPASANRRMLALLAEWESSPLTNLELKILDDFQDFQQRHPISFTELGESE